MEDTDKTTAPASPADVSSTFATSVVAPPVPAPAPVVSKASAPPPAAIRITEPGRGPEAFPSDDPRAGAYQPGMVYLIPDQVSADKAAALVAGCGYEYCDRPKA